MRIHFQEQGGIAFFPGLAKAIEVEVDTLEKPEADQFHQLIGDAHFFERPASSGPTPGAADVREYRITVEDEGRCRTLVLYDPVSDFHLSTLIKKLQRHREWARNVRP